MDDNAYALTEKGRAVYDAIINMLNDNLETDEIANCLGLNELQVKVLLILGAYGE